VFLNSCEGARGSEGDPFSGTAATLVRRGVPAVVAMQYQITDSAAIEFSRAFYESLADGLPVDAAVTEARVAVSMGSMLEWGTPVLYLRSPDGRIFDISTGDLSGREELLRRYREHVESIWADRQLNRSEVGWLEDRAKELGLGARDASVIERDVMGDTKDAILERKERLEELYAQARGFHENQERQAVEDVFTRIRAEDPAYPDPEGLFDSARQALDMAEKEENARHEYREVVRSAWADEELDGREVETLRDLADSLELRPSNAAEIEREVMGDLKEAILDAQERAAKERYREAVEEAWTDEKLSKEEAEQLGALASRLGLSPEATADIAREVTGDTVQGILRGQVTEEEARQHHLEELYARALRLHRDHEWQGVVNVFEQIHAVEPAYPDPEGLLESAREALESRRRVKEAYDRGVRHMDAGNWQQAFECFEEIQRLEPGYRETETHLSRVQQELAPPPTVEVPDLGGQKISQASSTLANKNLKLGDRNELSSDREPKGQIIGQSPEAGREVQAGTSVSVMVSSGPSTVEVPNLAGKSRGEARNMLDAAGLRRGMEVVEVLSNDVGEDKVVEQYPAAGSRVERDTSVRISVAQKYTEDLTSQSSEELPSERRPKSEKPQDLPD
jgi:tetratricopeptide (TPR) repeat protein